MKGRAAKRHKTEAEVARAMKVLKEHGIAEEFTKRGLAARARMFAKSNWGCNCGLCRNPRKMFKGKNRESLTLKERNHTDME